MTQELSRSSEAAEDAPLQIAISYDSQSISGVLKLQSKTVGAVWDRLRQSALSATDNYTLSSNTITVPWPVLLSLVREYAPLQRRWNFRFKPDSTAKAEIDEFVAQWKAVQLARAAPPVELSTEEIVKRLRATGFTKRTLKDFQLRDLKRLLSIANGANFSVPGAGKTSVTFALHLLRQQPNEHLLVVCPKSAFTAWSDVVQDCIGDDAPRAMREPFTRLTSGPQAVRAALSSGATRFIINYEQLVSVYDVITPYLLRTPVHVVLDESHRMKGGFSVKRGAALLNVATLPIRRDILSGTPMPQSQADLQSQLDFLWPGAGFGVQIAQGQRPKDVLGPLYVRTTKADLGLPPVKRHFRQVGMGKGQTALYAIVRSETLRDLSSLKAGSGVDIVRARRSVMRLLQLSANPVLALRSIVQGRTGFDSGIVQQVLEDGPSPKMLAVRDFARDLASKERKSVIWTIFTDTIEQMERMLADLNPVTIYGAIPSGEPDDPSTREGRLKRFHDDPTCMTLIANPAAAGEGISVHHASHDAIYIDRNYNTAHYLQSIDRIHRLGLPPEIETNIYIFQTITPKGLGCIDHSVSRRLATKLRALQLLLDDEDLHRIALDEESSEDPIDLDIEPDDLIDLIEELEGRAEYNESEGA